MIEDKHVAYCFLYCKKNEKKTATIIANKLEPQEH